MPAAQSVTNLRKEWAEALCYAIASCEPIDASQIMTAALESMETDGPLTGYGNISEDGFPVLRQDASWWADTAPQHELQEYVYAGIKELRVRALGINTRKRFILDLWAGLSDTDKRAFVARIGGVI